MTIEKAETTTEELLSRKSDTLSDYDRDMRVREIEEKFIDIVDEVCDLYEQDWGVISCSYDKRKGDVLDIYFSRLNGDYEMGLNHPFFREFIAFKKRDSNLLLTLIPKDPKSTRMVLNYGNHSCTTFDSLVKIMGYVYSEMPRIREELKE